MFNLQDYIDNSKVFKKFEVDELLFAEFKCPFEEDKSRLWWHNNFFAFVLSGETILQTPKDKYVLKAGDSAFAKKGSVISRGELHEDFCELLIFVPDDFIKTVVQKHKINLSQNKKEEETDTVIPLSNDEVLITYFCSLLTYFHLPETPPKTLLKLKFEELLLNILSQKSYAALRYYFSEICAAARPSVNEIMESNFINNLTLAEFAKLCARSLSSFKTEFKLLYHDTPGRWLKEKRLEYSRFLLETTHQNVDEISYSSGFKNRSHFIRIFKQKYQQTPVEYRTSKQLTANRVSLAL